MRGASYTAGTPPPPPYDMRQLSWRVLTCPPHRRWRAGVLRCRYQLDQAPFGYYAISTDMAPMCLRCTGGHKPVTQKKQCWAKDVFTRITSEDLNNKVLILTRLQYGRRNVELLSTRIHNRRRHHSATYLISMRLKSWQQGIVLCSACHRVGLQ